MGEAKKYIMIAIVALVVVAVVWRVDAVRKIITGS